MITLHGEEVKVGDRVWHVLKGWGEVVEIDEDYPYYPILVHWDGRGEWYTQDGKFHIDDKTPVLFWQPTDHTQAKSVLPIERDEEMQRDYIPLPANWEIQTKGKGSTFRLAKTDGSNRRWPILDDVIHEPLEQMAREIHAAWQAALASQAKSVPEGTLHDLEDSDYVAKRFRLILTKLGISTPESDEELLRGAFSYLGMARRALDDIFAAPQQADKVRELLESMKNEQYKTQYYDGWNDALDAALKAMKGE